MPPLRGSNAPRLCDRPTDRPTDRVDVIIINHLPNALRENQTHPGTGGFFRSLRAHKGRAPSPPSLAPSQIDGAAACLRAWSPWEVERGRKRGKGDSRARGREALEFLSRRRLQNHRENSRIREDSEKRNRQKSRDKSGSLDPLQPL